MPKQKLVIAEKPSVGMALAKVLGARGKRKGYMIGGGYIVSWCVGHLAGLADAAVYDPSYAKWRWNDLPIIPDSWRFTLDKRKTEQFDTLRTLMRREEVTEVINACDAGREGELIFRTAYHLAGCTLPMKRLWISSMEDAAIREGFANLRPGSDFDGLYHAALCRAKADWLVGINATRLFSVMYRHTLNVGRVMSPTLALLVQREAEIGAFEPALFYTVELNCGGMTFAGERISDKAEAKALADRCKDTLLLAQKVERKEKSEKAPALYDLTTLQREANRTLGYTAQQTLDYLQKLYEKKLCTYPRTDSRYLTEDMKGNVPALTFIASVLCGVKEPEKVLASQVCDNSKVSDHHAIVPTKTAATGINIGDLPTGEREILRLVALSLLRAVCPAYRYAETAVTAECGNHSFTAKGRELLELGWRAYADKEPNKDDTLPEGLSQDATLTVKEALVKEGSTTPPRHFTEDTILKSMECAGVEDMPEDVERKGIGTPATRASILEKLVSSGFVERKKAKKVTSLIPTQEGNSLITVLPEMLQSPLLTAEWENRLKQVEQGELSPEDFMEAISAMVRELAATCSPVPGGEVLFPSGKERVGPCPRCGGNVTESKKGFFCENPSCRFALWKDNRFFAAKKKDFDRDTAAALLNVGKLHLTGCWSEKTNKTYDATVYLEDDGEKSNYRLEFDDGNG